MPDRGAVRRRWQLPGHGPAGSGEHAVRLGRHGAAFRHAAEPPVAVACGHAVAGPAQDARQDAERARPAPIDGARDTKEHVLITTTNPATGETIADPDYMTSWTAVPAGQDAGPDAGQG